jgi:SNF2 family DNA or RNA helicase
MEKRILRGYQKDALDYTCNTQYPALFMEMRLGKSLTAIRSLNVKGAARNLIVAPFSTFYGWLTELEKEDETKYGIAVLEGSKEHRYKLLEQAIRDGYKWFLLNKEGYRVIPDIHKIKWESVLLDESPFLKNPNSQVSKYFTKNFQHIFYRYILSGSPATESELDYFQQLLFLDRKILGCKTIWDFRHKYFTLENNYNYVIDYTGKMLLASALAEQCFVLKRKDVDLGGEKIYETRLVRMTPKFHRTVQLLNRDYVLEDFKGIEVDSTLYATGKVNMMRRLCGGFMLDKFIFDSKLRVLVSLLQGELHGQKVIIWCAFTYEILKITKVLSELGLIALPFYGGLKKSIRDLRKENFQRGIIDALICQGECLQFGTDLSRAKTMIFYSNHYSLDMRGQQEDRFVNVSSNDSLLVIDLMVEDSVDIDIYESLQAKETRDQLMHRLIKRIEGYAKA